MESCDLDDLNGLLERIMRTLPADWRRVDDRGLLYGGLLVLQSDPVVSIGMSDDLDQQTPEVRNRRPFARDWAERFVTWKPPRWKYAEVRHHGQVITRHLMMCVDAGRAILPGGDLLTKDCTPESAFGLAVDEFSYQLARLLHGVLLGDDASVWETFDAYFERMGIVHEGAC